ncbi:MAG: TonB-dependent receptor, partial [Candidatus Aminicenantes bacterium]|nr:TonB-dependent receptor [Candidatus Aminicenantes bacterium]
DPKTGLRFYFGGRFIGRQYIEREMIIEGQDELEYHIDHVDSYSVWDAKITKNIWKGKYFIFLGIDNIFNKIQSPLYNAEQEGTAAYIYAPTTGTYIHGGIRIRF